MKYLIEYRVLMSVESDKEPDSSDLRDGIEYGINKMRDEGCLTGENNDAVVLQYSVSHESTRKDQ